MKRAPLVIFLLCLAFPAWATEYVFENFAIVLKDRLGTALNSQLEVRLGFFDPSFTPSLANYDQWTTKFTTDVSAGYYVGANLGGPEWSAALRLADNSVVPVGAQLRLWIQTPAGFADGPQALLLTDSSWLAVANSPIDVNTRYFDFSSATQALVGTFNFNDGEGSLVSVTAVPEPSYFGAFCSVASLGAAIAVRSRRRQRFCRTC